MKIRILILSVLSACTLFATTPSGVDFVARAEKAFRGTVRKAETHDRQMGVIELFFAAYYFCESGRHLDKLDVLFDVAAEMQDRDPKSRGFGNFRWYWRDGYVMDHNAADFCMQTGSLMARDHRAKMTDAQRAKFDALVDCAIQGCLKHNVRRS